MKLRLPGVACLTLLMVGAVVVPPAHAHDAGATRQGPAQGKVSVEEFRSDECAAQVADIAAKSGAGAAAQIAQAVEELCTGQVILTESAPKAATVAEAREFATSANLSASETQALVASAAASALYSKTWNHAYWGGSLYEIHTGKTYYNGSLAWIASYSGYSGSHTCHAEGSWAVGWAVTPLTCSRPAAASAADAVYRFDASVFYNGSPLTLGIGLHYQVTGAGVSSGWQVGG